MQRTRFLITVQLPLLEQYHARISSSLDAFETLSSSFMRAVPGALADAGRTDSRRLTSGVEGVQRLCKALVSAKYLAVAMEVWGEDLVSAGVPVTVSADGKAHANLYAVLLGALDRDQPQGGIALSGRSDCVPA